MAKIFHDSILQSEFDREGIISIPFLNTEEVQSLTALYTTQFSHATDRDFHSTMFINDADFRKQTDVAIRAIVLDKINKMLCHCRLLFANYIVKAPSPYTAVGIHQDWNFTSPEHVSLNIWIPLIDITDENGKFYALHGSHLQFKNIRFTPYADNAYADLSPYIYQNSTAHMPKAGHAIIYNGALVHYSEPNLSPVHRIAIGMALIPRTAPCLHYYKRNSFDKILEVYETDELFYQHFDFFDEPQNVRKIAEISEYKELPGIADLK